MHHDTSSSSTSFIVGIIAIVAILAVAYFAVEMLQQQTPPEEEPGIDVNINPPPISY